MNFQPEVTLVSGARDAGADAGESGWEEAFLRIESYLRAHHLESRLRLNELATALVRAAREQSRTRPGEAPVTTAMRVARERIGRWFAEAGVEGEWSDERVRVRGRLAWLHASAQAGSADAFLAAPPPAIGAALDRGPLRAGPELRFTTMPAAPLEFGFEQPPDRSARRASRADALRAATLWLVIAAVYGVAWTASH